jgi:hypothetical protein
VNTRMSCWIDRKPKSAQRDVEYRNSIREMRDYADPVRKYALKMAIMTVRTCLNDAVI